METGGYPGWLGNLVWGPEESMSKDHQLWFSRPLLCLKLNSGLGRYFSQ